MFIDRALIDDDSKNSFKDYTNSHKCTVCAKGALFCSFVGRANEITIEQVMDANNDIRDPGHKNY